MIDSRWVCKLTDFGSQKLSSSQDVSINTLGRDVYYSRKCTNLAFNAT